LRTWWCSKPSARISRPWRGATGSAGGPSTTEWKLTNGISESNNAAISRIRSAARGFHDPDSFITMITLDKRIGFGFRNLENYRIRAPLYAGKRNWRVLGSIVVR
jgi:hypothetical protein